jgi:hypothetical protein
VLLLLPISRDRRLPDGPLADPGMQYSRTGLVKRARTQKDWGDHRGLRPSQP